EHCRSRGRGLDGARRTPVLASLDGFYGAMAQVSFTLLGLWWVVVQFKYSDLMRDRRRRIQAYDTSLYFVLPGIMSLISQLASSGRPRARRHRAAPSAARACSTTTPCSRHRASASSNPASPASDSPPAVASSARPVTAAAA